MKNSKSQTRKAFQFQLLFTITLLILPAIANAEIFDCQGRWTNRPCDSEPEKVLKETASKSQDAKDLDRSEKESLLHELKMQAIEARRKYNARFDVTAVEKICLKPQTSLRDCKQQVDTLSDRIQERTKTAALIDAQEKEIALKEKDLELKRKEQEDNKTVVIIEDRTVIVPRRRRPPIRPLSGTGISVNINSADGSISAGGSVFSGSSLRPPRRPKKPLSIQRPSTLSQQRNRMHSIRR
jgi:hypothetical protein